MSIRRFVVTAVVFVLSAPLLMPQAALAPYTGSPVPGNGGASSRAVEEGFFEADLVGTVNLYRPVQSGVGTKFATSGGGGVRLVENLFSHWGLEQSFGLSTNNLGILNPVTIGTPTQFGMREFSFALNPVYYVTGLNKRTRPFLTAGAGVAYFRPTSDAIHQAQVIPNAFGSSVDLSSQSRLQFNYGGGVRWKVANHVGFLVEGRGLLSRNPSFGLSSCVSCGLIPSCNWLWGLELIGGVTFHWGNRDADPHLRPAVMVIPASRRLTPGKIRGAASVCAGSPVALSSDASDAAGSTLTYHWTVNGQPSGGNNRQLAFTPDRPGEYQIQLEVTDSALGAAAPPPSELALSVRALDCTPKPAACCSLDVACSSVVGELPVGGTAPLHVTAIGTPADKVHYNWTASEGRIVNPNNADATFDSTGVSFPASYQTQTKIITATASVDGGGATKACQTQITVKKDPEPVHYDVVFAAGRSRVNNCAKRFLIERLYPDLARSYRGYSVYLVGHRDTGETAALDRERALNVAAVLSGGKGSCGKLETLRVKIGSLGVAQTPYVETPCAISTESAIAERQADQIDYSDSHVKERRVEIWLVPEGQTLPLAVPNAVLLHREDIDRLGCPK